MNSVIADRVVEALTLENLKDRTTVWNPTVDTEDDLASPVSEPPQALVGDLHRKWLVKRNTYPFQPSANTAFLEHSFRATAQGVEPHHLWMFGTNTAMSTEVPFSQGFLTPDSTVHFIAALDSYAPEWGREIERLRALNETAANRVARLCELANDEDPGHVEPIRLESLRTYSFFAERNRDIVAPEFSLTASRNLFAFWSKDGKAVSVEFLPGARISLAYLGRREGDTRDRFSGTYKLAEFRDGVIGRAREVMTE